jgi:hypothetical protein
MGILRKGNSSKDMESSIRTVPEKPIPRMPGQKWQKFNKQHIALDVSAQNLESRD